MLDIWFRHNGGLHHIELRNILTAQIVWDLLADGGIDMVSARP